jgi:hypothetical protein
MRKLRLIISATLVVALSVLGPSGRQRPPHDALNHAS